MKLSKLIHIASVIVGFVGVVVFITSMLGGADNLVFGVTKFDALMCTIITILTAVWLQIAAIHHMMLEKTGEII